MIKRLVVTTALALVGGTSVAAAAVVWSGAVLIQAATPKANCDLVNVQVNEMHTAVFHPKLAGDATVTTDVLQILQEQKGMRVTPSGAGVIHFAASGNYNATLWTGRATLQNASGTYNSFSVTPATIVSTTPFVTIKGTVLNFGGPASGCTATISGAFVRKP